MSEYIFKPRCTYDFELDERDKTNPVDWYGTLHGEIVRCRDCENYSGEDDEIYPKWCMEMNIHGIEPDGYCAWAKRKEGGDD